MTKFLQQLIHFDLSHIFTTLYLALSYEKTGHILEEQMMFLFIEQVITNFQQVVTYFKSLLD